MLGRNLYLLIIAGSIGLAACTQDKPVVQPTPTPPPPVVEQPKAAPQKPKPKVPEASPRPRPTFDSRQFVGMEPSVVEKRFGKPSLKRKENFIQNADAEVWQYVSGPCVLHLYFYGPQPKPGVRVEAKSGVLKVEHVTIETRPGPWGDNLKPEGVCALAFSGK